MIVLPEDVLAQITRERTPAVRQWALEKDALAALVEALGRALSTSDMDGFVSKSRIAFALGDEITYPASGAEAERLKEQNTAIVQRLERSDSAFGRLVSELSRAAGRLVSMSAYIADTHSRAFSWHVDKWDNVVVQLQGRKAFDLAGSKEMTPGDVLFIPEDVEHRTRTLERSLHLSVAFYRAGHGAA
jgi:ribosomal protein L16 Arg81 hydroxylase